MSQTTTFRCLKCLFIPKIIKTFFYFFIDEQKYDNYLIIQCPNDHIEKKTLKKFISENRISLENILCKKCEKNFSLYYCTKCYKTICNECYNINKRNKILLKDIDTICYLHYEKYILKCGKCKLLICSDCMQEHKGHEKNNIYYNFYLKKYKNNVKNYKKRYQNQKKENKNIEEYYKFREILFHDYELFDKNKIYNNYIIINYKIITQDKSNYLCDKYTIDYSSQSLIEQNIVHKINNEKHFYTSNPMLIKLNDFSEKKKLIDYTLLDSIIYTNNNNENILVYSIYILENDNNNNIQEINSKKYCYLILKNIDINKYILKQISTVIYEEPKFSSRFAYFEKKIQNLQINYLLERINTQIAVFDLNKLEYIYYNNNIQNNNITQIIYKDNIFYICVVFDKKITLINIKMKQITSIIKYEKYIYDIFEIKNTYYIITEDISYNLNTYKKIQNYDLKSYSLAGRCSEYCVKYFNYKKQDTLIFYSTNILHFIFSITIVEFFSGKIIDIFILHSVNASEYWEAIRYNIFWNSNFIFFFFNGPLDFIYRKKSFICKVFDIFKEEDKYIMEYEDATRVMKYFSKNLGEIILYSYKNTGEIYIYKFLNNKNDILISKDEISSLIYPLRKKRKEEKKI